MPHRVRISARRADLPARLLPFLGSFEQALIPQYLVYTVVSGIRSSAPPTACAGTRRRHGSPCLRKHCRTFSRFWHASLVTPTVGGGSLRIYVSAHGVRLDPASDMPTAWAARALAAPLRPYVRIRPTFSRQFVSTSTLRPVWNRLLAHADLPHTLHLHWDTCRLQPLYSLHKE